MSICIIYSELMDVVSVENFMNYIINGIIFDIIYMELGGNEFLFVIIIYDMFFVDGQAFDIFIGLVIDVVGNFLLEVFVFDWIINCIIFNLVIMEIMYNFFGSSDDLEFVEILNVGIDLVIIGGLIFSLEFCFIFLE